MTLPSPLLAQIAGSDLEYANQTVLHPAGLAAVLILGTVALVVERRNAVLPFLLMACLIAPAQRLVVFGLDFNLIRIMVLFGWARVILRHETSGFRWTRLDTVILSFAIVNTIVYTMQHAEVGALVNRLGASFDTVGMYFLFRMLVRSLEDLKQTVTWCAVAAVPVAVAFLIENRTGRNLFAFLGGVPQLTIVRDGRLRCQGAFPHAILAGCFWASLVPLFVSMWWQPRWPGARLVAAGGTAMALLIIVLCASSTPVLAVLAAMGGLAAYGLRWRMRAVRWMAFLSLCALHAVMNAPVWHLIARVSAVGGSTGWHRYNLIDNFIRRWDEWIVLGTKSTGHWGYGMQDVTNQYVLEGVRGGILGLILFVAVIVVAFGRVGRLWQALPEGPERRFAWALGVSLFVHCVSFIGVSYFGQITMLWYLCLAAIGSASVSLVEEAGLSRRRTSKRATQRPSPGPGVAGKPGDVDEVLAGASM